MGREFYKTLVELGKGYDKQPVFAYIDNDCVKTVTYREFLDVVRQRCGYYSSIPQKRIGLWAVNSYEWVVNAAGMLLSGKTLILLDTYLNEEDLKILTDYTDAELIIADVELMYSLEFPDRQAPMKLLGDFGECAALAETTDEGEIICFTSGTSANAKGVVISAKTLADAIDAGVAVFSGEAGERFFMPIPYYHIYGFTQMFHIIKRGGTVCIGQGMYLESGIKKYRPDVATLVPSMVQYVVKQNLLQEPLHTVITGGAMLDGELVRQIEDKGIRLENGYGLSETLGEISMRTKGKGYLWQKPQEGVRFVLSPDGEVGIYLPFHMSEYYKKPEDTAAVLDKQNHLFWTGDAGKIDEDGCVCLCGRLRDTIVMDNGEKINAEDMDVRLAKIDGIKEAAVIGIDGWIGAVLVMEKENSEEKIENEVKKMNRKNTPFSRIVKVWYREEPLPRTSTGKLKRFELEKEYRNLPLKEEGEVR